jgi:hypothetical protein
MLYIYSMDISTHLYIHIYIYLYFILVFTYISLKICVYRYVYRNTFIYTHEYEYVLTCIGNLNLWDTNILSIVGNFNLRSKIYNARFNAEGTVFNFKVNKYIENCKY